MKFFNLVETKNISSSILLTGFNILNWLSTFFKPPVDGWRQLTTVFLAKEHCKFVLSTFGLDMPADVPANSKRLHFENSKKHIVRKLYDLLKNNPLVRQKLQYNRFSINIQKKQYFDFVIAETNSDRELCRLIPKFEPGEEETDLLTAQDIKNVLDLFIVFYNKTYTVPDKQRPYTLRKKLDRMLHTKEVISDDKKKAMKKYAGRILTANFVWFEECSGDFRDPGCAFNRFDCPDFLQYKHPGAGLFNIMCRLDSKYRETDLWFQVNHLLADGVPVQEMIDDIRCKWKKHKKPYYPLYTRMEQIKPKPCSSEVNEEVYEETHFFDFTKIMDLKKKLSVLHSDGLNGNITLVGMLIWCLSNHDIFKHKKFLFTIDKPEKKKRERSVRIISQKVKHDSSGENPSAKLLKFQDTVNEQIKKTKKGTSDHCVLIDLFGMVPTIMYRPFIKLFPRTFSEITGTIGISIIRNGEVFVAPYSDFMDDGFIAIGNTKIEAENGQKRGSVSIKAPGNVIYAYFETLHEVLENPDRYV